MTDYLEELLDEQEQEDVQQTAEWKKARISTQGLSSPADSGGLAGSTQSALSTFITEKAGINSQTEQTDSCGRTRGNNVTTYTAPEAAGMPLSAQAGGSHSAVWSLELELKRLHRAVRPWVGQRAVRMEQGTSAGVSGNPFPLAPAPGSGRAAGYVALVDTAFARDARRYDGPLRLL